MARRRASLLVERRARRLAAGEPPAQPRRPEPRRVRALPGGRVRPAGAGLHARRADPARPALVLRGLPAFAVPARAPRQLPRRRLERHVPAGARAPPRGGQRLGAARSALARARRLQHRARRPAGAAAAAGRLGQPRRRLHDRLDLPELLGLGSARLHGVEPRAPGPAGGLLLQQLQERGRLPRRPLRLPGLRGGLPGRAARAPAAALLLERALQLLGRPRHGPAPRRPARRHRLLRGARRAPAQGWGARRPLLARFSRRADREPGALLLGPALRRRERPLRLLPGHEQPPCFRTAARSFRATST